MPKKPSIPRVCEQCGEPFLIYPHQSSSARFCSHDCYAASLRVPLEARYWQYVEKTDSCWLWNGATGSAGYGIIKRDGRDIGAHRLAFEFAFGPIPDGMSVLHTCDNRACVRNDDEGWYEVNGVLRPRRGHLWIGMPGENSADMANKGRAATGDTHGTHTHPESTPRGENHPLRLHPERAARGAQTGAYTHPERVARGERAGSARMTEQQIRAIRARYADHSATQRDIAIEFAISQATVWQIVTRRTWRHVE